MHAPCAHVVTDVEGHAPSWPGQCRQPHAEADNASRELAAHRASARRPSLLHSRRATAVPQEQPPRQFRPVSDCWPGDSPLSSRSWALYPPWKTPLICLPTTHTTQTLVFPSVLLPGLPPPAFRCGTAGAESPALTIPIPTTTMQLFADDDSSRPDSTLRLRVGQEPGGMR